MDIALLGLGRLGRTLQPLLEAAGHRVLTWQRGQDFPVADVAWITVSDGAVAEVARALPRGPIVLHASGSLEIDVLRPHRPAGSLHPLQSFPGPEVATPPCHGVPAALAGDPEAIAVARQLAEDLGFEPVLVPGDRRLYHAAAVIAGNFGTTLLAEGAALLEQAGVPTDRAATLLIPLARASLEQALSAGPVAAMTGPFPRGDAATIRAHLTAIRAFDAGLAQLYEVLGLRTTERLLERNRLSAETSEKLIRILIEE
jgi:predicted short-subunit dehydrogenase-like oxidoreductase (DUF2520 family)